MLWITVLIGVSAIAVQAAKKESKKANTPTGPFPVALLEGGRRLDFIRELSSEQQLHDKRPFFSKLFDVIVGAPEWHKMARPYSITTDSRGRILVTDPGEPAVHIFDVEKKKYTILEGGKRDSFVSPIGIAVDADDNIYVTDSQVGKIFVFDSRGKFQRMIGDIKGEGFFKRATGISCDRAAKQLYVTDTMRDRIYVMDLNGNILRDFGGRGTEPGRFNFPTEVAVHGDQVYVVDAMNFRVQRFDTQGHYRGEFGQAGDAAGALFRPKGLSVDKDGNIYLVDASMETVQVFNPEGALLYSFGRTGSRPAEFELPSGIWIDADNRVYVADSYNHRVQVFRYSGPEQGKTTKGQ